MSQQELFELPKLTKVVHKNKDPYDVYIGRPSIWGNPYSHKDGTLAEFKVSTRAEAIEKYRQYFYNNQELMQKSKLELKGKTLGCWCSPQACHGDVIAEFLNRI